MVKNSGMDAARTGVVEVRYWASARAAAGVDGESVEVSGPVSVSAVVAEVVSRRSGGEASRLADVLGMCSVLVGDRPTRDRSVEVEPGGSVEFLPPFAGG